MSVDISHAQAWARAHEPELVSDLKTLVSIRSVSGEAEGVYPFGEGCARALDRALALAEAYGFKTENDGYHCGSVLYPGETAAELAVCAHLDVVPEGQGWTRPPYEPYLKDGWVYGRGAADNKGAAVASLFLLRYLKEMGIHLRHTLRLIYGCNEESGMADMAYYLSRHPAPDFVLVPDAALPAAYAEKAGINALFSAALPRGIVSLEAGHSLDSVPAHAECMLSVPAYEVIEERLGNEPEIHVRPCAQGTLITAEGLAAHAAYPERGYSAAVRLALAVLGHGLYTPEAEGVFRFMAAFGKTDGSALGIGYEDALSGRMAVSGCRIRTENGRLYHAFNCRGPVTVPQQTVWDTLSKQALSLGWTAESHEFKPFNLVDPQHPVIQALTRNASAAHGIPMKPYAMSGGTYARMFPRAVAAGFGLQGQKKPCPPGHGGGHQPDECVSLVNLENGIALYAKTLEDIDGLAF